MQVINQDGTLVISYEKLYSRIGKRVPHSEDNIHGWEPNIFSSQINFDNPILLCLGGAGIDNDKLANGVAKLAQELIGRTDINDKEIQLLSAVYPKNIEMLGEERKKFSLGQERERTDYIYAIYETILFPIIISARRNNNITFSKKDNCFYFTNIKQEFKNNDFDFNNIKQKLRNITIFSHCHGSFVACELANYLKKDLEFYGFSKNEIDDLLSEITNIMLSPRDGVQMCKGPLNIGFTNASDNLDGGVKEPKCKGRKISVSNFTDKLLSGKIKGSDSFYFKYGSLYNFWDTDTFGANLRFVKDYDEDGMSSSPAEMIYKEIFMGNHYHIFENYCSIFGKCEEDGVGTISKNDKGRNFTKMIAKALQNAVSLSVIGAKRTFKEIMSNETELCYRQGLKENNPHFKDVQFDGTIDELKQNYEKIFTQKKNLICDTNIGKGQR